MARILIVDDDIDVQEMYMEFLIKDYQVITAKNGNEGIKRVEKFKPEAIIMDMTMPICNGMQMLAKLKKVDNKVPVVLISGKAGMQDDPEIQLNPQVKDFFVKPINLMVLKAKLNEILKKGFETQEIEPAAFEERKGYEGTVFGNCTLNTFIGEGGAGKVYKGVHQTLNIEVAVKILAPHLCSDAIEIQRFLREGRILAKMEHKNIAKIINMGVQDDEYYIIMKYIKGRNLLKMITIEGIFPCNKAVDITIQTARGLHNAHCQNLVHRDVKPSNIIIENETGTVKVIDFGTARGGKKEQQITEDGFIVGTPYYISPEQCLGEEVDRRADIYSLGCSLYHMITGQPPFSGFNAMQTMMAHIQSDIIPPQVINPSIPASLSGVVVKSIQKSANDRYQDMSAFIKALEESLHDI